MLGIGLEPGVRALELLTELGLYTDVRRLGIVGGRSVAWL